MRVSHLHAAPSSREITRQLLGRPSLDYHHAFDFCARGVYCEGGSVGVFASSPFYARELAKRIGHNAILVPLGNWFLPVIDVKRLLGPEVREAKLQLLENLYDRFTAVIWAEPEHNGTETILGHIQKSLLPGGSLYVITSERSARFLPEWKRDYDRPCRYPSGSRLARKWLRQTGYRIDGRYGFHGPTSILWGYGFQLLTRLGHFDLADRCLYKMRAEFPVSNWQVDFSSVQVTVAR
jgi:hypothetical protein